MNWGLPTSVEIGGESYEIRTDFRVILDIFVMLSDPDLSGTDRAEGILQMFYVSPEDIPPQHLQEAVDAFSWFQNGGQEPDKRKSPKLVDWEQDYPLILPPINRIFGRDIREIPYDAETNTGTGFGVYIYTSDYTSMPMPSYFAAGPVVGNATGNVFYISFGSYTMNPVTYATSYAENPSSNQGWLTSGPFEA